MKNKININSKPGRHQLTLKPGQRYSFCRCWRSKTFPYCDGSHRDYSEINNDTVGPLTLTIEEGTSSDDIT